MKKIYKPGILFLLTAMLLFGSCDRWLDVLSNEEILEEDAFSSGKGYRLALIGAYRLAASENLWGRELSWGFMSVLGRNYHTSYLPSNYRQVISGSNFEHAMTKAVIANIWETGYTVIANCNNLLKNIEKTDDSFFEYSWERSLIIAEARGLRALMHFELLRLFAPAPVTGYQGKAIPYVTEYPVFHPEYKTMEEVFELIINDMTYAQEVLKRVDIDLFNGGPGTYNTGIYVPYYLFHGWYAFREDGSYGNGVGFFSHRGTRINYWGATALLARIYSYKRDNATAVGYINELINDEWIDPNNFYWSENQYNSNPNMIDGKRFEENFLALWNGNNYLNYNTTMTSVTNGMRMLSPTLLFGDDTREDYRYLALYNTGTQRYRVWESPTDPAYATSYDIINYSGPLLPVIELAELYYIRCEHLAEQGKITEAVAMLKAVKDARNITNPIAATDYDSFMQVLVNDASRDFLTRGQTWHYLKKLNWKEMYNGTAVYWSVPEIWYVLPAPDSEINYY